MIGSNTIADIAQQVQLAASMSVKVEAFLDDPHRTLTEARSLLAEIARIAEAQRLAIARFDLNPQDLHLIFYDKLERHWLELAEALVTDMASMRSVDALARV